MISHNIMHIMINILYVYMIYLLLNALLGKEVYNNKIKKISYIAFFIISVITILVTKTRTEMLLFNMIFIFLLSLNYKTTFFIKFIATFFIYSIGIIIEIFICKYFNHTKINILSNSEFHSILILVLIVVIGIVSAYLINKSKASSNETLKIPKIYYFTFIFISLGTIYLFINSLINTHLSLLYIVISSIILISINVMMIFLDNKIFRALLSEQEKEILNQQNAAYENQTNIINHTSEVIRVLHHDMKNHINTLIIMNEKGQTEEISEYTKEMLSIIDACEVCKSNNFVVDSIINFKLTKLKEKGVNLEIDICIPHVMDILAIDLTTILGNLLDNAVEATMHSKEKNLKLKMWYEVGNLIIILKNSYSGEIIVENGILKSTKLFKKGHGIGLKSVEATIKKYSGDLEINRTANNFTVEVVIPME